MFCRDINFLSYPPSNKMEICFLFKLRNKYLPDDKMGIYAAKALRTVYHVRDKALLRRGTDMQMNPLIRTPFTYWKVNDKWCRSPPGETC
jgi:hypothetical protein